MVARTGGSGLGLTGSRVRTRPDGHKVNGGDMNDSITANTPETTGKSNIRRVREGDLDHVIDLDARVTGHAKPDYWRDIFERYATRRLTNGSS